jgi:hypothetical protein
VTDTEALDLVQHYGWVLMPVSASGGWIAVTVAGATDPAPSMREAIQAALKKQVAWALSA